MNTQNLPEATSQDIENLINKWISEDRCFTKYDVTKQLRHDGFHVYHDDNPLNSIGLTVKKVFGIIDLPDDYTKTFLQIDGSPALFHPDAFDPQMYDQFDIPMFKITRTVTDDSHTVKISTKNSSDLFDVRGRFSISAKDTRNAGFSKGDTVKISTDSGNISISGISGDGREVKVDCYFNIRIPKTDFENAFDILPSAVSVEIKDGTISVKEDSVR